MFAEPLLKEAASLLERCRKKGVKLATAESCTGGLIAALLTEIPGSSDVFERGFVTYSNDAKRESLGVVAALIEQHGAVSEPVALAMARGALAHSHADIALSVTGVAGPGGGSAQKPIGLVVFGLAVRGGEARAESCRFNGNRSQVRMSSVEKGVTSLAEAVEFFSLVA